MKLCLMEISVSEATKGRGNNISLGTSEPGRLGWYAALSSGAINII